MTTEDSETPSLREAALLALDALRMPCDRWSGVQAKIVSSAIKDLTAALAVPDEPVAWQSRYICPDEGPSLWMDCKKRDTESLRRSGHEIRALCVESQPDHGEAALDMVRRPLTGEQKETLWRSATLEHTDMCSVYLRGMHDGEKAHGINQMRRETVGHACKGKSEWCLVDQLKN